MLPTTPNDLFNKRPVLAAMLQLLSVLPQRPAFALYPFSGGDNAVGQFFDINGTRLHLPQSLDETNFDFTILNEAAQMVASFFEERQYPVQFRLYPNNKIEWGVFLELQPHINAPIETHPDYPAFAATQEEEDSLRAFIANPSEPLNRRGPKPKWTKRIQAPPQTIEFYTLLAQLALDADAFADCHPYKGAVNNRTKAPVISFKNQIHMLPRFVATRMGLPEGKKSCATPGCMNPFHYVPLSRQQLAYKASKIQADTPQGAEEIQRQQLVGDIEALDYYIATLEIPAEFDTLRSHIPHEDMDDARLEAALAQYKR